MKITYFGHSCFFVETSVAKIIIDPFLTGNPAATTRASDVHCDYVLVSHGHSDHMGDALAIAKSNNATIVANWEICNYFAAKGAKVHHMNPGGSSPFPFGRVKLTLAHHSSSDDGENTDPLHPVYLGSACGLLIEADAKKIYHAGDTALFLDMQLISHSGLDVAMLPIGDTFTMGPEDALDALGLLKPKLTIPMHYNTWPPIKQDVEHFAAKAQQRGFFVNPLSPGKSVEI